MTPPAKTNRVNPTSPIIHAPLPGDLAAGSVIAATDSAFARFVVAGAERWRCRILTDNDCTLKATYLRPDTLEPYAANNPANVNVTGGTETKMDVSAHFGEAIVEFEVLAGASDVTIAYADVMAAFRS